MESIEEEEKTSYVGVMQERMKFKEELMEKIEELMVEIKKKEDYLKQLSAGHSMVVCMKQFFSVPEEVKISCFALLSDILRGTVE